MIDYLNQIHIRDSNLSPTLNLLCKLQKNHIETFGWDTLDLFLGRKIHLNPEEIIHRFIIEKRGGICYELNGAFCHLLRRLGFDAYLVSAYVYGYNDFVFNFSTDTHAVIVTSIGTKQYLVDVGWGHSSRKPVPIHDQSSFSDLSGNYRLRFLTNRSKFLMEKFCSGEWKAQYHFSLKERDLYHFQANLDSRYSKPHRDGINRQLNCIKSTHIGYLELKSDYFLIQENDSVKKADINGKGKIPDILKQAFGMHADFVDKYFCNF